MQNYKDTGKVANPLKFKVGSLVFDHNTKPSKLVRVELCRIYSGEADFTVQGVYDRDYVMNYIFDSHDYTGDGPEMLHLTLATKKVSK
jgi:hypothetical protein